MDTANILAGICLLMFGRRLFWLFVGVTGFLYGLLLGPGFIHNQPGWVILGVAVAAGVLGSLLAIFLQRVVIVLAGFSAGSYLAYSLMGSLYPGIGQNVWIVSIIVGVCCAVLFSVFFDWAIILLSSLLGAFLITHSFHEGPQITTVAFAILAIAGVAVQANLIPRKNS
ncbi:MAG TPA: DUF4203 domain-containing protein [Deltaproteobacteria bacterium]|nr:DUF4203 domain-containing protein [Deltaproteobacteria bacterium]HQJ08309.1 DUF4203 domain-containing protein [Deltaproteobacteria bacterium]